VMVGVGIIPAEKLSALQKSFSALSNFYVQVKFVSQLPKHPRSQNHGTCRRDVVL
jgi:hypothetical protein